MAWTPADITTVLWVDASDTGSITTDGSGNVEQWDDKSGNANHVTQVTSGNRPSLDDSLNSVSIPTFDSATGQYLDWDGSVIVGTSYHVACVFVRKESAGWLFRGSASSSLQNFIFGWSGSTNIRLSHYSHDCDAGSQSSTVPQTVIAGLDFSTTAGMAIHIDGVEENSCSTRTSALTSNVGQTIGHSGGFDCAVAEIIILDSSLSDDSVTLQKIEGYLAHKWGLTSNLPSDHPYKTYAPGTFEPGGYNISGGDLNTVYMKYKLRLGPGSFDLTGSSVDFRYPYVMSLGAGIVALSGWSVGLNLYNYKLSLSAGSFEITGGNIDTLLNRKLALDTGSHAVTGGAINFGLDLTEQATTAVIVYLFTLTGAANGTTDIEIPISTIQARMRSGEPTYLQVTIPGLTEYMAYVNARANGSMKIDVAYLQSGEYTFRETIINVTLQNIRIDEGPFSKSITLTGRSQKTYSNKSITLYRPIYKKTADGSLRYRFAEPHVYLFPGDTVTVGTDTFVADNISYYVGARTGGMDTTMEVAEA